MGSPKHLIQATILLQYILQLWRGYHHGIRESTISGKYSQLFLFFPEFQFWKCQSHIGTEMLSMLLFFCFYIDIIETLPSSFHYWDPNTTNTPTINTPLFWNQSSYSHPSLRCIHLQKHLRQMTGIIQYFTKITPTCKILVFTQQPDRNMGILLTRWAQQWV